MPKKKSLAKVSPVQSAPIALRDIIQRIFDNNHKSEDLLLIGEKIRQFRESELFILITATIDYVVNSLLDGEEHISNDEKVGIQKGARRVLTTILGLDKQAVILNQQMDYRRKVEIDLSNEINPTDADDYNPRLPGRGGVGI